MKHIAFVFLLALLVFIDVKQSFAVVSKDSSISMLIKISQQLLLAAKTNEATDSFEKLLRAADHTELKLLVSDNEKKAFWLNIYNAYTQLLLQRNPDAYKNRSQFFNAEAINISGRMLSLDDIEHGLLRRSKVKWALGYLNKWFPEKFEKENRVSRVDYRIHFALNCGAKSCPPIAFYDPGNLDQQLDLATRSYLHGEAEYNDTTNTVKLPATMSWFRGDFGGKKKVLGLLKKLKIIPADKHPAIVYKKYDWNIFLDNYKTE